MNFSRLLLTVAVCALVICQSRAVRAFDVPTFDYGNNAPMPAAVVQLFTDLNNIPPGTDATDAQHQALVADLNALATGVFAPDPDDIDQLATDLATAATNGLFSDNVLEYLADDFIGDPDDPTADPDGWMDDIQDDVSSLIDPPDTVFDPGDPGDVGDPVDTTIYELGATPAALAGAVTTRVSVQLAAQNIPAFLLENYSGRARLETRTAGGATVSTLRLHTAGLPPSNPYTVSITRASDGGSVTVGKLHVHSGFDLLPVDFAVSGSAIPHAEILSYGHAIFGGRNAKKPLPDGFDAADVSTVTLTDSQGVVRLLGTVANELATSQVRALDLHLTGTATTPAAVPDARVTVHHKVAATKTTDRFRLMARHLPVSAPVTLWADGVAVDQYTTTAHGRLFIIEGYEPTRLNRQGISPSFNDLRPGTDLSSTKTFTVTDSQGTTLLSGSLD